ncbi:MAG: YkvA family protein [Thermaurantiacus tibetensis]|uniref:YkvA family protein n=1 Tax=Thermaurantiacus tibetensis TaxID=2759035 RepID=UPI00188F9AC5|nr:YkvA family protein [Thermaurantiacus tibetensis]
MPDEGWLARVRRRLARDAHLLWLAARDPRTPVAAKLLGGLAAAYALSPVDLIPDVVPVLGLLDDLVIVPLGLGLALRLVPRPLAAEFRAAADAAAARPVSRAGAWIVGGLWLGGLVILQLVLLRYW